MKRGVSIVLVLLVTLILCASNVLAALSVDLNPLEAYETNSVSFALNISNFRNAYEITEVSADVTGFEVTAEVDYKGWTETHTGSEVRWTEGSIANNVLLAVFEFLAEAPVVEEDSEQEASVVLTDDAGETHTYTFPLSILNDDTPPEVSELIPEDNGFVKQGDEEVQVSAKVQDNETGIEEVTFHWQDCENENATAHTLQLAEYDGAYQNTIDLSAYQDGQQVCFEFSAYNRGGDETTYTGTLTVDGIPPEVTLVSPLHNAVIGLNRNFSFFASDNLATDMRCSMYIDGIEYITDIEAEHMDVEFIPSADAEEGEHTWSMTCTDPAGWDGESATWTYSLDKTPPTISMTAPENDSIVADTTMLEFQVTDNHNLWKAYFVFNGTQEEVDETFAIDISGWPDGPSEFTVIAEDSVGNRAEQTYRIIIDRSAPTIELVSPAEGDTSDVHVEFVYSVLDDYDDAIDCTVYIDDTGEERHTALSAEETVRTEIVQVGTHRWKVQCVDDAGNSGESDERSVTVIDTSGPDIEFGLPAESYRGDPVDLSLHITDMSGVEAVTATLRNPDDTTQTVPLERLGDDYIAQIDTELDWDTGTYMLVVYAVDTLNNSNTAEQGFELMYRYFVALEVTPSTTAPGSEVTASGTVVYDDSTTVPEEAVTLLLPGNVSVDAGLENGEFSHAFTAPTEDGVYEITASIVSEENSKTYTDVAPLTVYTPAETAAASSSGGGGGGGHGSYRPSDDDDTGCTQEWSCTAFSPCAEGKQSRTCVDINKCGEDSRRRETITCEMEDEEEEQDNDTDEEEGGTITPAREPLPDAEEHEIDATEEDKGITAGVGKASSFIDLDSVSITDLLLVLALMGMLLGVLYKYGWSKGDNRKKPAAVDFLGGRRDKLGLEDYLNERASRPRW
ncbi:hypothetical protein KY362_00565 [Candidatus Woesearchaeota archaeon]|nr:hypothetical protein [Candidatus Woesearchaeota archaeon]